MPLIDVTLGMRNGMLCFPGDPPFEISPVTSIQKNDSYNLSGLKLCTHTGTHVDAPRHYFENGYSVDNIPLDCLIGHGIILEMRGKTQITAMDIENSEFNGHARVLFKTDNSLKMKMRSFSEDFSCLTPEGARFLMDSGVAMVGVDYLSIESFSASEALVHKTILGSGAVIVEGLDLSEAPPGPCVIYCLPLKIIDGDGAPARVLIEVE